MPRYTLPILGLEISFRTDADSDRVTMAKELIEERFNSLNKSGNIVSKEKLLICLALSLADDYLQSKLDMKRLEEKIARLLAK
jgi:cell division protein ZapA